MPNSSNSTPAEIGVTTGAAAPTNSVSGPLVFSLATHTFPEPSIAMP